MSESSSIYLIILNGILRGSLRAEDVHHNSKIATAEDVLLEKLKLLKLSPQTIHHTIVSHLEMTLREYTYRNQVDLKIVRPRIP